MSQAIEAANGNGTTSTLRDEVRHALKELLHKEPEAALAVESAQWETADPVEPKAEAPTEYKSFDHLCDHNRTHALIVVPVPKGFGSSGKDFGNSSGMNVLLHPRAKCLSFRLACKLAREWNEKKVSGESGYHEKWHYVSRTWRNSKNWVVLEVKVPRDWKPVTAWDLCPNVIPPEFYNGMLARTVRELNRREKEKPVISRWAALVHLPLSEELLDAEEERMKEEGTPVIYGKSEVLPEEPTEPLHLAPAPEASEEPSDETNPKHVKRIGFAPVRVQKLTTVEAPDSNEQPYMIVRGINHEAAKVVAINRNHRILASGGRGKWHCVIHCTGPDNDYGVICVETHDSWRPTAGTDWPPFTKPDSKAGAICKERNRGLMASSTEVVDWWLVAYKLEDPVS